MPTLKHSAFDLCVLAERRGVFLPLNSALDLLRASLTLKRWAESECSDPDETRRARAAKRGEAALKRARAICAALTLHLYHQTDPRGCALYVSSEPLTAQNCPNGIAVG